MKRSRGYTIIELLVASAMSLAVISTLVYFVFQSTKLILTEQKRVDSVSVARFVSGRITSDVIESRGASTGSGPNKLVIGSISYEIKDAKVRREAGSDVSYLSDTDQISSLNFIYPSNKLIRVEIVTRTGEKLSFNVSNRN